MFALPFFHIYYQEKPLATVFGARMAELEAKIDEALAHIQALSSSSSSSSPSSSAMIDIERQLSMSSSSATLSGDADERAEDKLSAVLYESCPS